MKQQIATLAFVIMLMASGCTPEKKSKDRSAGDDLFRHTVALAERFALRMENTPDSVSVSDLYVEFEDSLEKLNFSYPPDTDLLLTEGQNDTIHDRLMRLIEVRDERLQTFMRRSMPADTIPSDSLISEDASRNPGN
ncbi:MAG: hypothetical protein K2K93_03490 [Muribaculaceae bacterium]|nr:hypothetical protein [Muribaculaceae bacterium]